MSLAIETVTPITNLENPLNRINITRRQLIKRIPDALLIAATTGVLASCPESDPEPLAGLMDDTGKAATGR